jgi:hypothetical protein
MRAETRVDEKRYRAGEPITDLCRACKAVRGHTVIVASSEGQALRVMCDFCGSQHDFRGGGGGGTAPSERPAPRPVLRERREAGMSTSDHDDGDLERTLRRVLRQEMGLTPVAPAEKWRGGEMVLRPGRPGLQEKKIPIETFFHKIVMIRNRLRTLEQQVNAAELPDDAKLKLQSYVTGCYGTLTSFNVLFADEDDQFKGSGGE